ncbi:MAG: 5'/3'-nucleotidase SurE [Anderseniella sp.]|nr:5'/3'-nucleotidase SurE [Anderseniella sp.]
MLTRANGEPYRILLANDDGINAPGLEVLEAIAAELSDDVWVVAPESEQSGAGRSISLSHPLRMRELGPRRFAVEGTPADSVLMGVRHIMPEAPDLILSGVNRGQNIADDVTYSGTIAAAMEGTALGIRSMALSQTYGISGRNVPWDTGRSLGAKVVKDLVQTRAEPGVLLNINFPDCDAGDAKGVQYTRQGQRDQNLLMLDQRTDARGRDYFWIGFKRQQSNPPAGTDLHAVYNGFVSVTPLHTNLTQADLLAELQSGQT